MKTTTLQRAFDCLENMANGNLTEAKHMAVLLSVESLIEAGTRGCCWRPAHAIAAANFLKGNIRFQEYCDIEIACRA